MRKKTSVDTYTVGDQYATLTYGYNDKGYITSRGDLNTAQYENFTYDAMGRLTQVSVDGVQNYCFGYDGSGNMTLNSRVSADYLGYDASLPHAVELRNVQSDSRSDTAECYVDRMPTVSVKAYPNPTQEMNQYGLMKNGGQLFNNR